MTLEEAIKNREDCLKYLEGIGRKASPECLEAVRWSVKALKALRPVSREQVEKVWKGKWKHYLPPLGARNGTGTAPPLTPPNEPPAGGIAMRHQYTCQELESITQETAIYIEGAGIAQLQWGGWEIATHIHNGRLCLKHEADRGRGSRESTPVRAARLSAGTRSSRAAGKSTARVAPPLLPVKPPLASGRQSA